MTYDEASDFAEKRKYVVDFLDILSPYETYIRSWRCLEVGGAGGSLAGMLGHRVGHVIVTDVVNSLADYSGDMLPLLKAKFERNGESFPMERVEFLSADAQFLPFRDNWFDLCYSQNAFEHIPDPELALREAVRVTRPGGYIYLMFDPLWTADSGSHFLHHIGKPWAHLLESDDEIARRMLASGASDTEVSSYRDHMNRLPLTYYRDLFARVPAELGVDILVQHEWSGCTDVSHLTHPNRAKAAATVGLTEEDLLVRGFRFLMRV